MTQNLPDKLTNLQLTRVEGIQSILTLLNLIKDPSILYDRSEDEIITANNALFLLTNLGENEFIGQSIRTLLPDNFDSNPISGHNKESYLRHKNQPSFPVNVRIFTITQDQNKVLIQLQPEIIKPPIKYSSNFDSDLAKKLKSLIEYPKGPDTRIPILQTKLCYAADILNFELICIYKLDKQKSQFTSYLSNDPDLASMLPNAFSPEDERVNSTTTLWTRDKKTIGNLQKSAAYSDFNYLLVLPIEAKNKICSYFVACGKNHKSVSDSLNLSSLVAAYFSNLIEEEAKNEKLNSLTNKIKQVVKIQNEIIANLDEGVLILSPDLIIAEVNPSAESILGYANVEALRQPVDSILIGSESLGAALTSAKEGIPSLTGGDLTLHHRNGDSFPAQVITSPVMNNGQIYAIIVLIRDLSEQHQSKATNKQLEQRAILGEVTAIFAHEVRNPINAIMLSLQVIEEDLDEADENHKWIGNIRDECNKLLYLMDSVLSFAKPLEYKMASVDLDYLLPKILERWHPRLLKLNIFSYYESVPDNPFIKGDIRALEQVFTNLISNSVNAMSEKGGSLSIKVSEADDKNDARFFQVTITDSGHGIPDEIKAHMFKPFVTGSKHGTGLGLAITQRIINAHKGKIEVESYPGGTIFKIYLQKQKGLVD